jgi:hypothetical protein
MGGEWPRMNIQPDVVDVLGFEYAAYGLAEVPAAARDEEFHVWWYVSGFKMAFWPSLHVQVTE